MFPQVTVKQSANLVNPRSPKTCLPSDVSLNLKLDDSDASPAKKVKRARRPAKSTLDSASESDDPVPRKSGKKGNKKKDEATKVGDSDDGSGVLPVKKITKTKRMSKKAREAAEKLEAEEANDSEDNELLGFVESNGGKLEEPKPLFELNADGSLPVLPQFAYKILEKDFGHKSFRPHQAESILRIACGLSTVVVLPTGEF